MNRAHVVLTIDVSDIMSTTITVPESFQAKLMEELARMGTVKIQFGVQAEYTNISEEKKTWITSNAAVPFIDSLTTALPS